MLFRSAAQGCTRVPAHSSSRFHVRSRWLLVAVCWGTIGLVSLWALRDDLALWRTHFTWVSLRYAIAFNRLPALGLSFCIGLTVATLIAHSHSLTQQARSHKR